jgi:hypothetical protein
VVLLQRLLDELRQQRIVERLPPRALEHLAIGEPRGARFGELRGQLDRRRLANRSSADAALRRT